MKTFTFTNLLIVAIGALLLTIACGPASFQPTLNIEYMVTPVQSKTLEGLSQAINKVVSEKNGRLHSVHGVGFGETVVLVLEVPKGTTEKTWAPTEKK